MTLKNHINIAFDQLIIDHNIKFLELWKEVDNIINFPEFFDLNKYDIYKRIVKNYFLSKYFIYSNKIEGDILECGVFKGFSAYLMRLLQEKINNEYMNSQFFLIDSFEGLSKIQKQDKVTNPDFRQFEEGHFKTSLENVEKVFNKFKNVNVIKGWIPDIFNDLDKKNKYKFVHLDVDLYQPTLDSLNYIYDKVVIGGVILTDDYYSPHFPGNKIAWRKFFLSKNIKNVMILPSGQSVYIKDF